MSLLHEPVLRSRRTFKVAYISNWHRHQIRQARQKELDLRTWRWSIETLHKVMPESDLEVTLQIGRVYSTKVGKGEVLSEWRERGVCATAAQASP